MAGMDRMRRLVCEFYDGLNFGRFVRKHSDRKGLVTDVLIGDLFKEEVDDLWPLLDSNFSTSLETVIVSSLAISAAVTESISNSLGLWFHCMFSWSNRHRSRFVGFVWFPDLGLRHREPEVRGNLKA